MQLEKNTAFEPDANMSRPVSSELATKPESPVATTLPLPASVATAKRWRGSSAKCAMAGSAAGAAIELELRTTRLSQPVVSWCGTRTISGKPSNVVSLNGEQLLRAVQDRLPLANKEIAAPRYLSIEC